MTRSSREPVVRGFEIPAKTSLPYTYGIWYRPDPEDKTFLAELAKSPFDLYHVGYQAPFKAAFGPAYGGELYTDDILPPHEVQQEMDRVTEVIEGMREAGVGRIIPYVFTMAFFGEPQARRGFFHFYDHWDEYRQFGLGPRPEADPSLWSQVRGPHQLGGGPPGILHYDPCINHPGWLAYLDLVIRHIAAIGYDGVFFDVNTLYCFCPHCEARFDVYLFDKYGAAGLREAFGTDDARELNLSRIYPEYKDAVLGGFRDHLSTIWAREDLDKLTGHAEAGAVMLEKDSALLRCYVQDSRGEFPPDVPLRTHLTERFGTECALDLQENRNEFLQTVLRWHFRRFLESEELRDRLQDRFGNAQVRKRCCESPRDLLLWVETQRFWCNSVARLLERLKEIGRCALAEVGREDDFYTVQNFGPVATLDGINNRRIDGTDLRSRAPVCDMAMCEEMLQPGATEAGVIISNAFAFRWAMAAGTQACTLLYHVSDDCAADLAHAEVAAGGGGAFVQCCLMAPESRRRWKHFLAQRAELWERGVSHARVALLYWSDQTFYEYPEHLASCRAFVHIFSENQVPFDIIVEENVAACPQYDLVVAPMLRYLDDSALEALFRYVKNGGDLLVVDPFGTDDAWARPREHGPMEPIGPASKSESLEMISFGSGRILRLPRETVPARRSDLWVLMEDRANDVEQAHAFLNAARQRDMEKGVDLGPRFLDRLEQTLGFSLRWCSPETDPGIYLHAYRIPGEKDRPERIVVHLLNYRMPIIRTGSAPGSGPVSRAEKPVPVLGTHVRVPLPPKTQVHSVWACTPTEEPASVGSGIGDGHLSLAVDSLSIYQAIVIDIERQTA